MEKPSTSYVRKISTTRRTNKENVSENNFIKNNKNHIKNITTLKENTVKKQEITFNFGNSATEILKTRSGLTINRKEVEQEFERIKLHDQKLQKKIQEYAKKKAQELKIQRNIYKKKIIPKIHSKAIGVQTCVENLSETAFLNKVEEDIRWQEEILVQKEIENHPVEFLKEPLEDKVKETVNEVEDILSEDISNSREEIEESEVEDTKDVAIEIRHVDLKRRGELEISQTTLARILEGREDFLIHGNYLKKFGIHRGSMSKFWDFLELVSKEILDEILENQLEYIVNLCDQFVDDLIKDEL